MAPPRRPCMELPWVTVIDGGSSMKQSGFSLRSTRRQLLAGTLALAASPLWAQKKYGPRIVCNMYYWVQLFSTPFRYIASSPDPLKAAPPGRQPAPPRSTGGMVWTDEQWHTALSDVQYAGYRRMEMVSWTVMPKPLASLQALLKQYGLIVNHLWHGGTLYPAVTGEKTLAGSIEVLERAKLLQCPEFFFDPFGDR